MKRYCLAILAACAWLAGAPAANAGPREDVMSAASQCFALADDRAWLACYLGAARPMQATLGTPPAAGSAPSSPPLAFGSAPAAAPARVASAPPPAARKSDSSWFGLGGIFGSTEAQTPQQFGRDAANTQPPPENKTVQQITARLTSYAFTPLGTFSITLDNGQVWQQIDGDTTIAVFKLPARNYVATIKHGFFGSYNLTIKGVIGLFRVHRIK